MAEFCSECDDIGRDYDLVQMALDLDYGHSISFLCEGCNRKGIYKDERGCLYVATKVLDNVELVFTNFEDLK